MTKPSSRTTQRALFRLIRSIACVWLLAQPAFAQKMQAPEFVAESIDAAATTSGRLGAIDESWKIQLEGRTPATLHGAELIALRRKDARPVVNPSGSQILLANGDRIRAIAQQATAETLDVNSELLGNLSIPLERVSAVLLNPHSEPVVREQFCRRLTSTRRKHDVLVLGNGDELSGSFLALNDATVRLQAAQGPTDIQRTGVRAIAFSSELTSFPEPKQLYAVLLLADGSELAMLHSRVEGVNLRGRAAFGAEVSVPLEQIVALEFRNGRVTYLSDLDPADYRHTPYLGVAFSLERDRSVSGNALSLRGQNFRKGLGMHSQSHATYALHAPYQRFEATVGIDDETGGQGHALFRVLVDGEPAWESPPLTGRSAPVPVRVPLNGAKQLELVVEFGEWGDVQDHADWADARLIR